MGLSNLEPMIAKVKENWQRKMLALKDDLFHDLDALHELEPLPPPARDDSADLFLEALEGFQSCASQIELLTHLLDSGQKFVPRLILFILKERKTHGWSGRGFQPAFLDTKLKKVRWSIESYPELVRAVKDKQGFSINFSDLSALSDQIKDFEGFIPLKACFYPILVRNKVAAVLYADSGSESSLDGHRALQMLAYVAGLELTMITMKLKKPVESKPEETPQEQPPAAAPAESEPTAADEAEPAGYAEVEAMARGRGREAETESEAEVEAPAPEPAEAEVDEDSLDIQKAKRVARVLVSDLMLYHEAEVAHGQSEGNLYELLKVDIDRSYQHYQERVGDSVPGHLNFFKDELIKQLADGNPELLGELPF